MAKTKADCYLINTGWTGGKFGTGKRCPLKYTRAILDAIHDGSLAKAEYENLWVPSLLLSKPFDFSSASTLTISFLFLFHSNFYSGVFNLAVPKAVNNVPSEILNPRNAWADTKAFDVEVKKLGGMFTEAFEKYAADVVPEVLKAGPSV